MATKLIYKDIFGVLLTTQEKQTVTEDYSIEYYENDSLKKTFGIDNYFSDKQYQTKSGFCDSVNNNVASTKKFFKICMLNKHIYSLIVITNAYAGDGGSGSEELYQPLTFNLRKCSALKICDLYKKKNIEIMAKKALAYFEKENSNLIDEKFDEKDFLWKFPTMNFAAFPNGIVVYYRISFQGKTLDIGIKLDYENSEAYMQEEFKDLIGKKND